MKAVARINTQARRFDLRLAASTMEKNTKVATEVLSDEHAMGYLRDQARELVRMTELNLMSAVQAYLKLL